ncbi:MAG: dephospho-CoA kinase, partial [Polaromonas sp.]|nr:dephospho-CoA kinase [Polaromonas sp.]
MTAVRRIGLTGGIGSGKSTVAQILKQLGAVVVDADAISRQLTAIGGEAIPAIVSKLGAEAIGSDGAMNRDAVRTLLFNDPTIRQQLEAIIHPLVGLEMTRLTELAVAAGRSCVVY